MMFDPNDWILEQHDTHVGAAERPASSYRTALRLSGPNPAVGPLRLEYELASDGPVCIDIYDVGGRLTRTLFEGRQTSGRYAAAWDRKANDGLRAAAGPYFCRLSAGTQTRILRLVLAD